MNRPTNSDEVTFSLRDVRLLLEDWQSAGVTQLPSAEPIDAREPSPAEPQPQAPLAVESPVADSAPVSVPEAEVDSTPAPAPSPVSPSLQPRVTGTDVPPAKKVQRLQELAQCVAQCRKCEELASTRTQTVFGVGDPNAKIMFVGEAPGADEDKQGEPFVGRAGQLLNKIIEACEMQREQIYICNILRCRPPGNRNPSDTEAANCREFLDGQIAIVRPEYIVCWGSVAARNLLGGDAPIGKMRGKFYQYNSAKVLCTYHPSYLLRNPSAKKDVWEDMQFLFRDMGIKLKAK